MTLTDRMIYRFFWWVSFLIAKVWLRLRVYGAENVPAGPCVLAPVHRSGLDTPLVGLVSKRRLRFMGKDSLWQKPAQNWFLTALGGFPVARGTADREALKACIRVIERGEPLVMFPEGTRQSGPEVNELFDGPAYVAVRTGAPIVPIGIGGSEQAMKKGTRLMRLTKVTIVVGAPIQPPATTESGRVSRRAVHEVTEQLHTEMQKVFDEAQQKLV